MRSCEGGRVVVFFFDFGAQIEKFWKVEEIVDFEELLGGAERIRTLDSVWTIAQEDDDRIPAVNVLTFLQEVAVFEGIR